MPRQIGLTEAESQHELWMHRLMAREMSGRVLGAYSDIPGLAKVYEAKIRKERGLEGIPLEIDEDGNAWDEVVEEANEYQIDLDTVRDQLIGLATSGIYHLWEQRIKKILLRKQAILGLNQRQIRNVKGGKFKDISDIIIACRWNLEAEPFYIRLNELRLIANTVKHGDGQSCEELHQLRQDLFLPPDFLVLLHDEPLPLAERLHLWESNLEECSQAVDNFRTNFPRQIT